MHFGYMPIRDKASECKSVAKFEINPPLSSDWRHKASDTDSIIDKRQPDAASSTPSVYSMKTRVIGLLPPSLSNTQNVFLFLIVIALKEAAAISRVYWLAIWPPFGDIPHFEALGLMGGFGGDAGGKVGYPVVYVGIKVRGSF